jgi:hypothetical protein
VYPLALFLSLVPEPVNLDTVTVERARVLSGRVVVASFVAAKPAYSLAGRTMIGAADRDDGAERGAVLRGRRLDARDGDRVTVTGALRVITHRPAVVNNVLVPGWVEVRVEE